MSSDFLNSKVHEPATHQIFWCNQCDTHQVDSQDKDSGNFYVIFGHQHQRATKEFNGDYVGVMFALCAHCK